MWGAPRTSAAVPKSGTRHPVWPWRVLLWSIPALNLGIWGFGVRCVARGRAVPNGPAVFVSRCPCAGGTLPLCCSPNVLLIHTPRPAPQVRGQPWGGDTQGWAAEGRPEPRVGFQLRCSPGCAHSRTHGALKSHIILGALTPQTPLAQNPALLTRRAGGEQETQSSAALVVCRGISAPLTSSAASRNAPQVKRAQGKTLRAPLPLSQTRNRLLS